MKWVTFVLIFLSACQFATGFSEDSPFKHYSIEQFLNTKNYVGGVISFDDSKVIFSSDETGIFNIYSKDIQNPKGELKSLTASDDSAIFVVSTFPKDDRFLYTSDGAGNELNHIFLWENAQSSRDLTPYSGAKAEFMGWSQDLNSFFFLSNHRDPKYMDLYEMEIEDFTSKLLFKNEQGFEVDCISPDKRSIIVRKIIKNNNYQLFLHDVATKGLKAIMPHAEDFCLIGAGFSLDSKTLYFMTNENDEFYFLCAYALESGHIEILEKYDWDIKSCYFSHYGKYRVTIVNEDGCAVLKVYDQEAQKPVQFSGMPEGNITLAKISSSEKWMLFGVNNCDSPNNLYVCHLPDGSIHPFTDSLSLDIDQRNLVKGEVIRYPSYDGLMIPALYYKPKIIERGQKIPALIWVHGGPGGQSCVGYSSLIQYLVNHGYAVIAVNNRGSSGYGKTFYEAADRKHGEADLDDCIWAKKFLISTGYVDADKIGMIGGSYGGYMTLAALAFRPSEMAVGVDLFGLSNWISTLKKIPAWWEYQRESLYQKIGDPEKDTAYLESISPLFHAKNITKPLLVIQGANDPRVLQAESDQIVEAVSKNGTPYRYEIYQDEGHGFTKKQNKISSSKIILEFLDEYLKKSIFEEENS
ncbi:alpha/beta hydrolase family protein [Parachlamydia acanthamoebae]|uniref:alpha/beta hydrolase family protein n=1 Tax=Parachlamydia acanthamoebae TaxID=83552 RepID=UPI0007510C9B|nr:S9 family peptidase [Parachlamydia acanthamoebae]